MANKFEFKFSWFIQHGTTQASELVDLVDFFTKYILPELQIKNGENLTCSVFIYLFYLFTFLILTTKIYYLI